MFDMFGFMKGNSEAQSAPKEKEETNYRNGPYSKEYGSVCYTVYPVYEHRNDMWYLFFGYFVEIYVKHKDELSTSEVKEIFLRNNLLSKEFPPTKTFEIDGINIKLSLVRINDNEVKLQITTDENLNEESEDTNENNSGD